MSSHADTIREALSGSPYGHEPRPEALAALNSLLAENQRLRDALTAIRDSTYDGRLEAEQFAREALAGDEE